MSTREIGGWAGRSQFIFTGSVERARGTTVTAISADAQVGIVRIDEVFVAPEVLGRLEGREITVRFAVETKEGEYALFFANGWLYGDGIAVIEVGRAMPEEMDAIRHQIDRVRERADERALLNRIRDAQLVVHGRVMRIRPLEGEPDGESEHDPQWFIAELQVESVEKGRHPRTEPVLVAFPTSRDVMWYRQPRAEAGQDGIWILRRERIRGLPSDVYTAPEPHDVQPRHQLEYMQTLIKRSRTR